MHLNIPPQRLPSLGQSINSLFKISNIVESSSDQEVILDFTDSDFLSLAFLGGLHCLKRQWILTGRTVTYVYPRSYLRSYLQTIRFEDGLTLPGVEGTMEDFERMVEDKTKSYLPITYFPCFGERLAHVPNTPLFDHIWNSLVATVKKIIENASYEYWQIFPYIFDELGVNVQEHSQASHGTFALQYYPSQKFFQVVIADAGVGILKSYDNSPHFSPKNEMEALQYVMQGKSSKNRPENESRGFGIGTSRNILVNGTEGSYTLWSGKTFYIESTSRSGFFSLEKAFPHAKYIGSMSILQIPLRQNLLINFDEATQKF